MCFSAKRKCGNSATYSRLISIYTFCSIYTECVLYLFSVLAVSFVSFTIIWTLQSFMIIVVFVTFLFSSFSSLNLELTKQLFSFHFFLFFYFSRASWLFFLIWSFRFGWMFFLNAAESTVERCKIAVSKWDEPESVKIIGGGPPG